MRAVAGSGSKLLLLLLLPLGQLLRPLPSGGAAAAWNDWPGAKQPTCCSRSASSCEST